MTQKLKQVRIIDDAPAAFDGLESHSTIAHALFELVQNSPGGKTIGLEGAWGSGKSSVIKILEEEIKIDKNFHLYKFDAWAHQGEPLRRAFLEGIFDKIVNTEWFQLGLTGDGIRNKWSEVRDNLSRKIKTTSKSVTPQITRFGKVVVFLFLFLPLGFSIISSAISAKSTEWLAWKWYVGGSILLLPVVTLVVALTWTFFWFRKDTSRKDRLDNIWAVFLQKSHSSDITRTVENADRTTIEFQNEFKEFMSDVLSSPKKRLIIVVDNLDRVSDKEAELIWPVLRSFVDNSEFHEELWFGRLWVIIPYAPNALKISLGSGSEKEQQKNGNSKQIGFLEKVIQINFSVPTPILTNLKRFITENLRRAFGEDLDVDTSHKIFSLVSAELTGEDEATPRIIISIINNMVGTVLQWRDIDLISHAYFSLLRRKATSQEIGVLLTKGELSTTRHVGILPESVALDLAVLVCNVPAVVAAQKLYSSEMLRVLTLNDNGKKLFSDYQKIGYPDVLSTLLGKIFEESERDSDVTTKIISNLMSKKLLTLMTPQYLAHSKQDMRAAMQKISCLPLASKDFIRIVKFIVETDKDNFFLDSLVGVLNKTKIILENNPSSWSAGDERSIAKIVSNVNLLRKDTAVRNYFSHNFTLDILAMPGPFDEWIRICAAAESSRGNTLRGFPPKMREVDIFREMLVTNNYSRPVGPLIAACVALDANGIIVTDEIIVNSFVRRINRQAEFPLNEAALTIPFIIRKAVESDTVATELFDMNPEWVYYYFGAIFSPSAQRVDNDLPELKMDLERHQIISNLIFLWLMQGMKYGPEKGIDIILSGRAALRTIIASHHFETEIKEKINNLIDLKKGWREKIEAAGKNSGIDSLGQPFAQSLREARAISSKINFPAVGILPL